MQRDSIIDLRSAKGIWDHLHKSYINQQSGVNIHYYYQWLYAKKWDSHSPITNHIGFYLDIWHCITDPGYKVNDHTVINAILLSLPNTIAWKVMKQNLLHRGNSLMIENMTAELVSMYDHASQEENASNRQLAFISKPSNTLSGSKADARSLKKKTKLKHEPKAEDTCYNCGEKGHWSLKCPSPRNQDRWET